MKSYHYGQRFWVCCLFLTLGFLPFSASQGSAQKTKKSVTYQDPIIWQDPGDVESLDFTNGAGGLENAPAPPFTFVEEDMGGSNPKVKVTDANSRRWGVKWGSEVNAEVFATRIAWAAGYFVEPAYFVKSGKIIGATKLERAKKYLASDGSFTDARFELKEEKVKKLNQEESWRWTQNPFVGSKELNGLKIIMMLTSNWDSKDQHDVGRGSNTAIFQYKETGAVHYLVTDWGGSMGKWGSYFSREKWDCHGFAEQTRKFIKGVKHGNVEFGYSGQRTEDIRDGIKVSDLRWLMNYVGRITDQQIQAGLRASGATAEEVACFTKALRERLQMMKNIVQ
ncbi:MAG: hypothetical protein HY231_17255 [Acidobacteria bacterium]|nr:hypothetical protein [Acidobacteriota bacterium]